MPPGDGQAELAGLVKAVKKRKKAAKQLEKLRTELDAAKDAADAKQAAVVAAEDEYMELNGEVTAVLIVYQNALADAP